MNKTKINPLTVLTFVLLLSCTSSFGQQNANKCNIREYGNYVNLAELAITDSAYQKAYDYYENAFNHINSPFAIDRYNATVCAALLGDYEKCRKNIIYLLGKGINKVSIAENEVFKDFLLSETGKGILDLEIEPTYNINLRRVYDSILTADQSFRQLDPLNAFKLHLDTILKIDASNVKLMNELINKYGWPTEDLIGIGNTMNQQQYEIIIIHQRNPKYRVYDYSADLKNAYENCLLNANRAQYLIARIRTDGNKILDDECKIMDSGIVTIVYDSLGTYQQGNLLSYQHKTGFLKYTDEKLKEIDIHRQKAGLESMSEFRKKIIYSMKDKRFLFQFNGGKSLWTYPYKADYDYNDKVLIPF